MRGHRRNIAADACAGAMAGALATWVLGKVTEVLYAREDRNARARENRARRGQTAYGVAAGKLAAHAGRRLDKQRKEKLGGDIHWILGLATGAAYGVARPYIRAGGMARGLGLGTAVWLMLDEAAVPLLGLTPGPLAFPWQTHARALAAHLAFGLTADAALAGLQRPS